MQGVVLREVVLDTGEEFVLKGGFHVGAWARGCSDDVVEGVVGAEYFQLHSQGGESTCNRFHDLQFNQFTPICYR